MSKSPLVVIVGPTASGKSDLGVRLARKYNGEVVSADSRQVYKGMDIGSGKITKSEMMGVPHHLLDVASPKRKFSVSQYQKLALKAIKQIHSRGKLAILVGGTPFYIYSVIDNYTFPEVKPNPKLRGCLTRLSNEELLERLEKLDFERAATIEQKNKRRLIRALEIVMTTGKPVPKLKLGEDRPGTTLILGVKRSPEELKKRIHKRLLDRINPRTSVRGSHGMVNEVRHLHTSGLPWKRLEEFGLEYRYIAQYLQQKISKQEMLNAIQKESEDFARRQMTWFKKDPRIHWITSLHEAQKITQEFTKAL